MKLSKILEGIEGVNVRGNAEIDIPEIRCDSRLVGFGDMDTTGYFDRSFRVYGCPEGLYFGGYYN